MSETAQRSRGRPTGSGVIVNPQFVRDVSEQAMISYYNDHQDELKTKLKKDPDFPRKMLVKAIKNEPLVRAVLRASKEVKLPYPECVPEICYLVYLDQLDEHPVMLQRALDAGREPIFRERATFYTKTVTRILNAIESVRSGKRVPLKRPPLVNLEDDDDEF